MSRKEEKEKKNGWYLTRNGMDLMEIEKCNDNFKDVIPCCQNNGGIES